MNPHPLTIIRDIEQPPGGWRYTVPETGLTLTGATPRTLKAKIVGHLKANGLDVPDDDTLDYLICSTMGLDDRWCGPPPQEPKKGVHPGLSPHLANQFMKTMLQVVYDRKFVSKAESQRRLAICADCPMACGISSCWNCSGLFTTISRIIGKYVDDPPADKQWCGACGCRLSLKVLLDNETLDKAEGKEKPSYHESCWRINR